MIETGSDHPSTDKHLPGQISVEGDVPFEAPSMAEMRRDFLAKMEREVERYRKAGKVPPITGGLGDYYYGLTTPPHRREQMRADTQARLGGIYSARANDWQGAILEFVPTKAGKVRHGRLMKVSNPGTPDAHALIGWTHVQDMTHAEIIDMTQEPWPLPDCTARVIQQPRIGRD
jgi:hypothetical protein